jgi:quinol monooxygenase YgiN
MIVYAVELEMDAALREEYLAWLQGHVAEMLALPGFLGADVLERVDPPPPAGRCTMSVHYRLRDRAAWEGYLSGHAPRMREAGLRRFGERVRASRQVLRQLA